MNRPIISRDWQFEPRSVSEPSDLDPLRVTAIAEEFKRVLLHAISVWRAKGTCGFERASSTWVFRWSPGPDQMTSPTHKMPRCHSVCAPGDEMTNISTVSVALSCCGPHKTVQWNPARRKNLGIEHARVRYPSGPLLPRSSPTVKRGQRCGGMTRGQRRRGVSKHSHLLRSIFLEMEPFILAEPGVRTIRSRYSRSF